MKYGELTLGQIEAVVNKLGGMDGVKRFLSGEPSVADNFFRISINYDLHLEAAIRYGKYDFVNDNITEKNSRLSESELHRQLWISSLSIWTGTCLPKMRLRNSTSEVSAPSNSTNFLLSEPSIRKNREGIRSLLLVRSGGTGTVLVIFRAFTGATASAAWTCATSTTSGTGPAGSRLSASSETLGPLMHNPCDVYIIRVIFLNILFKT